jgi:hypothetical protein
MIFAVERDLLRVQRKWAGQQGDALIVRCYSARGAADGVIRRTYAPEDIDAIAAYCAELNRCYELPARLFAGRAQVHLLLAPARNNQSLGIHWASAFEFESLDWNGIRGP